tara:strand:+ start:2748 stop:4199 length:1452 start_codon:yes stop_codon:yes gene_type:complete
MATTIIQRPLYGQLPVGQDVIFTVENNGIVYSEQNVKFTAEVHISPTVSPDLASTTHIIGTFKTTPNNAGVGIFDLSSVIENYVSADNIANQDSLYTYKTEAAANYPNCPIHLIDKYSGNTNTARWLAIKFKVEYLDLDPTSNTFNQIISVQERNSEEYIVFNGYLKETDSLEQTLFTDNFGYSLLQYSYLEFQERSFLTNAPTTQYANSDDYGTFALNMTNPITKGFLSPVSAGSSGVSFKYYDSNGTILNSEIFNHSLLNGGFSYANANIYSRILYLGAFPANLKGHSAIFRGLVSAGTVSYYTVTVVTGGTVPMSSDYTIKINCPTLKAYKPIRLTWLNQWGAWDYYTFTMKSSKSISTKKTKYQQLAGTWNESTYKVKGYKGGNKTFRVNATEIIKMNSDFISEEDSAWFEELINSPEVYILEGFQTDVYGSSVTVQNQYVTPVILKTSKWTKKTKANDKLIQYTFEVEKSRTLRTQSI